MSTLLEYTVSAHRVDSSGSVAGVKSAEVVLDTSLKGGVGPKRKLAAWNTKNLLAILSA